MVLMSQELVLDQTTFSPEIQLQLARITSTGDQIVLEKLRRPVFVYEEDEYADERGQEEDAEIITLDRTDLESSTAGWKIVPAVMSAGLATSS